MIVRDEAAVIGRCIASLDGLIETWTICDTGSVDATPELVEAALAGVPGTLHHTKWSDFGTNRSELMRLAHGSADYLLLIDADMTVTRRAPLPQLSADAYLIRHSGSLDYLIPRLVRGDRAWHYVGATHEYLAADGQITELELPELLIDHHADSGTRAEKFERDARLLEAELKRAPDDARSTFYLAQTRRDLGDTAAAIELYSRRVALGGWDEEVYYAALQHGILVGQADPERGVALLDDAAELRPGRAEALYEASRLLRYMGRHREALDRSRRALQIPYPEDRLFVHRDIYEWRLRFEVATAAQLAGEIELALDTIDALLVTSTLPSDHAAALELNRSMLLDDLKPQHPAHRRLVAQPLERLVEGTVMGEVRLTIEPDWPQFNPSVARAREGFRMIVRSANYRVAEHGYEFLEGDETIRTLNYLVELNSDLQVESVAPLSDVTGTLDPYEGQVQGYEDCRLFEADGRWWATATTRGSASAGVCRITLLELEGARIVATRSFRGPDPERHEKNWMPLVRNGQLLLVYSCSPTAVYSCDLQSAKLVEVAGRPDPALAPRLRGGSQGIAVDGGWLFVVHEVDELNGARRYLHRFVCLDHSLRLRSLSAPFTFTGDPIELCAGLCRGSEGELVLSFGVGDRSASLARCPEEGVMALLDSALAPTLIRT